MKKETICVHGTNNAEFDERTGAVSTPIYQSATFKHSGVGMSTGFDYSRLQNPTRLQLEKTVAALEGGACAVAYSTGMAAISNLMELFSPSDRIIATEDLYGGVIRLFRNISEKNGIHIDFTDTSDINNIERLITKNTRVVFIESPTNPMMLISDIPAIARLTKKHGIMLVVDNTFLSPYFMQPLKLGADIVVHSGTKFLCGHNDTLCGFLVTKEMQTAEKIRFIAKTVGACLSPFDSWLTLRGIKTLGVRMEKQQQNAMATAEFLAAHKKVKAVYYAGLPSHKGHEILKACASGFGSMISFEADTPETAERVLSRVRLIAFAESLGGVETLITYPAMQTHADIPEAERLKRGINLKLLRLSLGIEDISDIIDDLKEALD